MSIGIRIKTLRKKKGLTQAMLAEKIGKSEISIRKYEANSPVPRLDVLNEIALALEVSINELLDTPRAWFATGEGTEKDMINAGYTESLANVERSQQPVKSTKIQPLCYDLFNEIYLDNGLESILKASPQDFIYKDKYFLEHVMKGISSTILKDVLIYHERIQAGENIPAQDPDFDEELIEKLHDPKYSVKVIEEELTKYFKYIKDTKGIDKLQDAYKEITSLATSTWNNVEVHE